MLQKTEWEKFRENGLLWAVNSFLHVFGFSIVYQYENGEIVDVYPARVKFRGFSEDVTTNGYIAVSKYMADNADELLKEASDED